MLIYYIENEFAKLLKQKTIRISGIQGQKIHLVSKKRD